MAGFKITCGGFGMMNERIQYTPIKVIFLQHTAAFNGSGNVPFYFNDLSTTHTHTHILLHSAVLG